MKLSYPSERMNIWPEGGVESLTYAGEGGEMEKDETQKISILTRRVPAYYQEKGVWKKSRGAGFLELQLWLAA